MVICENEGIIYRSPCPDLGLQCGRVWVLCATGGGSLTLIPMVGKALLSPLIYRCYNYRDPRHTALYAALGKLEKTNPSSAFPVWTAATCVHRAKGWLFLSKGAEID